MKIDEGLLRFVLFWQLLGAPVLAAGPEDSGEEPVVSHKWLTWTAPAECPSRSEFLALFEAALGRPLDAQPDLSAEISVTSVEGGFFVRMRTSDAGGSGIREVTVPSCVEAADFVVLSIALALDQETAKEVGPAPAVADDSGTPGTVATTTEPDTERRPLPSPETIPAPAPTTSPPPRPTSSSETLMAAPVARLPRPQASRSVSRWFIGASFELATELLPEFSVAPSLRAGRSVGDWEIQVSTTFFPGGVYELEEAFNPVALSWLGGSVGGCRFLRSARWSAGLCVHAELGGLTGREQVADAERPPHAGTGFFLGVVPKLEGRALFGKHFQGLASAGAAIPLVADPFILSDGTEVFHSSPGFRGSLGLLYFF